MTHSAEIHAPARYPIRQKSANGQPPEEFSIARTCRRCRASFRLLAAGKTGERGLWNNWGWYCSQECYDASVPPATCPTCDGRGVWMDEPCECVTPPGKGNL